MAFDPITANTVTFGHVSAYDARRMIYAATGPFPHRCAIDGGENCFQVTGGVDEIFEEPFCAIAPGVLSYHGYIIANETITTQKLVKAASGKYKKAVLYFTTKTVSTGQDQVVLNVDYTGPADSPNSISWPELEMPENDDYIITDELDEIYNIPIARILINGNTVESVEQLVPVWNNKQFYTAGDEIDLSYMISAGYIAANSKNIYFFVPFRKDVVGVTGATISGNFTIRHADGGFIGNSNGQTLESLGTVNIYLYDSGAYVRCILNDAAALANQSVLSVHAANGAKLTFN